LKRLLTWAFHVNTPRKSWLDWAQTNLSLLSASEVAALVATDRLTETNRAFRRTQCLAFLAGSSVFDNWSGHDDGDHREVDNGEEFHFAPK
jgi:hypothetical protein